MTAQETMNYAQSEEQSAEAIRKEIEKEQAEIAELQNDINSKSQMISGLQSKMQQHLSDAQRLRQQAADEERQEQEENARRQREDDDSLAKKGAKEVAKQGFFGF